MSTFQTWFDNALRVERYPMPGEIAKLAKYSLVLNVSDEIIQSCANAAVDNGIYYQWLPMNECVGEMGLNSLFGAMVLLFDAEQNNQNVLLHCHAGVNRSQTVAEAYHFMRTGTHLQRYYKHKVLVNFHESTGPIHEGDVEDPQLRPSMLKMNCKEGLLPDLVEVEAFLIKLQIELEGAMVASRGGLLTSLKSQLNLR